MFWTLEKLVKQVNEMAVYRYGDECEITNLRGMEDPEGANGAYPPAGGPWQEIRIGDRWRGRDLYMWLAADVRIPAAWEGRTVLGRFDFGSGGGGNNVGCEALLFVDGHPYQGVDKNHPEVFFPANSAGRQLRLAFRLWSGLNGYAKPGPVEHQLRLASVCWLDEAVDDFYFTSLAAVQTIQVLSENDPIRHQLLSLLNRAFLEVDWSRPGSEPFRSSVRAALAQLREDLRLLPKQDLVTVRCIGHTHIDVAWLWRLRHTREKAARSFSTVLRLMEQDPSYRFLQTQPQLYEYVKSDYPEIYERIRARVREGRWEAGGAMWLEADCNIPSGESLVRQLLHGTRFLAREFGVACHYLWLPDVFGYCWALPQILAKSGIRVFMTTKISWNQYNRMPHDTFYWRGMDGTQVLTHFITTPEEEGPDDSFQYTYNGTVTATTVQGIWETYRDKPINRELLLAYGYGDGGGGVNRDMLELRKRLSAMPGLPRVTTGRADDYFSELEQRIRETDEYVHTWDGELYLELHRGTYTSQAWIKRMNRKLELMYRHAEWLGVMSALLLRDDALYGHERLTEGWLILLRNQFHDIIPGSSIAEVYADSREEYAQAERLALEHLSRCDERMAASGERGTAVCDDASDERGTMIDNDAPDEHGMAVCNDASDKRGLTVYNDASWTRDGIVSIRTEPVMAAGTWRNADGERLEAQRTEDGWEVLVRGVPSMGFANIYFSSDDAAAGKSGKAGAGTNMESESGMDTDSNAHMGSNTGTDADKRPVDAFTLIPSGIETPYYLIEWDTQGRLTRIYDKQADRDVLEPGQLGNRLQAFEDKPKSRHEAWDIDLYYQEKRRDIADLTRVEIDERGPLRAAVRFEWRYGDSIIAQRMLLYKHSRRIDFRTVVEWRERQQLLKAAFPVQIRSCEATYDVQFGNVSRPTHWNTSWDYARFESVGHQWADLSERDYGVSLLNDCKYGYDVKDNVLRLSLIKSATVPDPEADLGRHEFTYALYPHRGDWYEGGTVREAWELNAPMRAAIGCSAQAPFSLLSLSAENITVDAVKRAEDGGGAIVRMHEYAGMRSEVSVAFGLPHAWWQETDLMEQPIEENGERAAGEERGIQLRKTGPVRLRFRPYEIRTVFVHFHQDG